MGVESLNEYHMSELNQLKGAGEGGRGITSQASVTSTERNGKSLLGTMKFEPHTVIGLWPPLSL